MRGADARAYARFTKATEWPMLVLSLAFLPIIAVPLLFEGSERTDRALTTSAWLIWGAFAAEYGIKLYLAPDKREMVRTHVLDLLIILLPFLRPLRAARVLRVAYAGLAIGRAGVSARRLLTRRGFSAFLLIAFGVVVLCGLLVWVFEQAHPDAEISSPVDGVWWALVTSTTVGYGDMVPVSPEGRGLAVLLMLVGIALLSVVTANIAAFFVEESDDAQLTVVSAELTAVKEELQQLRSALSQPNEGQPGQLTSDGKRAQDE